MIFIMVRLWPRIYCKVDPKTQRGFVVPRIVRPGETLSSTQYERRAGGKGANQAVAIAKAGAKVSLSACIGQDGTWIMRILKDAGVNTEEVSKSESVRYMNIGTLTKLNWLLYYVGTYRTRCNPSHSWRRELYSWVWDCLPLSQSIHVSFVVLYRGANYVQRPVESMTNTPFTHCLLQNEIPLVITTSILSHAKAANLTTIFNPSPILSDQEIYKFPWKAVDWLVVNEGEARALVNAFSETLLPLTSHPSTHSSEGAQTDIPLVSLITQLRSTVKVFDTVNFVCTLGAAGVTIFFASGNTIDIPALNVSGSVVDTTGAGDCFTGYFVAGLMECGSKNSDLKDEEVERIATMAVKVCCIPHFFFITL